MTAVEESAVGQVTGCFVAIVGPSGVGKDSLIAYSREALSRDPRFVFVRRVVIRIADAALEDHDSLSPAEFDAARASGRFALAWRAHDLGYALPGEIRQDLAEGRTVIANISRASIEAARVEFDFCRIISVTAPREIVARRLAARGRESAAEIEERLNREQPRPSGPGAIEIDNSGELPDAGARLVAALEELAEITK
ncbi:phosphonate metabolism protein/1,5-bisphosphokinase (PRPP-forming) PhnN [Breoghania sp.]|uniref:phosphonate metabolism protein/1,5-bisphosphokinase (PRPP-forming) PhnN n=1 Tax=Breoghania sp. TaxID=2065378 RepID=UPI00260E6FE4|nr:phosphonate metabolism protein/1,5-bisphosphokinase (PRPP-forming) PhnN [Breoghania sp.]MDJ0930035.1 phosphonate metabolism protein/1,5-bisphosphokinase (PRPP-forming) PhnN [Breoghania sp.]